MEITSNWSSENGVLLQEIVQESDSLPSGDLESLLDEEKCISLVKNEREKCQECLLKFAAAPGYPKRPPPVDVGFAAPVKKKCVKGIMILSEARVIEICLGIHEEYHKTTQGTLMGDFGDSKIYKCEMQFEKPQEFVVLKLKGLYLEDAVWIYGLHTVVTIETLTLDGGCVNNRFGSEHLSAVLKDKGVHMSKQATKFHQILENFNSGAHGQCTGGNNPMNFMSMMFAAKTVRSKEIELDAQNGNESNGSKEIANEKNTMQMSEMLEVINQLGLSRKGSEKLSNGPMHREKEHRQSLQLCDKEQTINNFQQEYCANQSLSGGGSKTFNMSGKDVRDSSAQIANLFEKLHSISSNGGGKPKEFTKFSTLLNEFSKVGKVSKSVAGSNGYDNVHQSESNGSDHIEGHCKCELDDGIFNTIENIIDKKLAAVEERIMRKIEQKFEEKAVEDTQRQKRLEELFSKIYEKL